MSITKTDCNLLSRDQEPRDLYRDIDQIQMIDIQYYNQFMSVNDDENENVKVRYINMYHMYLCHVFEMIMFICRKI